MGDLLLVYSISVFGLLFLIANTLLFATNREIKKKVSNVFIWYLILLSVIEVCCHIIGVLKPNSNFFISHFYFGFQFIVLSILYYNLIENKLFRKMNIFILPSLYKDETLPISMLEAMASGCYIIVSDVGVISEVVNLETTTLLSTDELNSKDISRTILQVLPSLSELDYHVDLMKNNFDNKQVQKRIFNVIVS